MFKVLRTTNMQDLQAITSLLLSVRWKPEQRMVKADTHLSSEASEEAALLTSHKHGVALC